MNTSPSDLRSAIDSANVEITAATMANDMELAQTLVSRKVGWRILAGEIPVKLKWRRL